MDYSLLGFYLTVFILAGMIAYAGVEKTLNLFKYIDLLFKEQIVLIKLFFMRLKLKRELNKSIKKLYNDRKNSI